MQDSPDIGRVVKVAYLREYFHDALRAALLHQQIAIEDQTSTTWSIC